MTEALQEFEQVILVVVTSASISSENKLAALQNCINVCLPQHLVSALREGLLFLSTDDESCSRVE